MKIRVIILGILCFYIAEIYAQNSVESIRKQREKTLKEIEYANKLLEETRGKTKESLQEVNLINQKLKKRREYILTLEAESSLLDNNIAECELHVNSVEKEIDRLKGSYADMVVRLYREKGSNFYLVYLLASENLNQLYRRFRFMKIYMSYIRTLKSNLESRKKDLVSRRNELISLKNEKGKLVSSTRSEYAVIKQESNRKTELLNSLRKKQGDIEKDIKEKERVARKLDSEITRLIESERKKAGKGSMKGNLTPMDQVISNDFGKNQGKLPWPTQKGIISGRYGEHEHPDFKYVKIRNDGIYISTEKEQEVRSVFKGVVSKVFSIPGENYTVIIRHGEYFTLYHNLIDVRVKAGQRVETREVIGKIFTDGETKESTLYFQVWKETERNDPELWLAR